MDLKYVVIQLEMKQLIIMFLIGKHHGKSVEPFLRDLTL